MQLTECLPLKSALLGQLAQGAFIQGFRIRPSDHESRSSEIAFELDGWKCAARRWWRRKRLARLLRARSKPLLDGIQFSEALAGDGGAFFKHARAMGLEGIVSKRIALARLPGETVRNAFHRNFEKSCRSSAASFGLTPASRVLREAA
jgi:hypothetical protein